ncbi:MAG TPA: DUF2163 domain-containing protein [Stellaceae bacterium]|nr:DUF2163 domain-containing protein [Stellaceae bacterium]
MRPCPAALATFLAGANYEAWMVDLYTFALSDGLTLRYTGGNAAVTVAAAGFADPNSLNYGSAQSFALGPRFGRSNITTKVGVEAAELDIDIFAAPTDLIGTFAFADAVRIGLFDGATVELDRLFGAAPGDTSLGCLTWFCGRVAACDIGRSAIAMKVKSLMNLLAVQQMPRRLFAASCSHIFGDAMCGYNRATGSAADGTTGGPAQLTVTQTVATQSGVILASPIASNIFDYVEGTLVGATGANTGYRRTIASISPDGTTLAQLQPWLYPVAIGDQFYALPGCDHSTNGSAGCALRNNLARFGGFPYIPPPEMAF